jgi:hypothetical protein
MSNVINRTPNNWAALRKAERGEPPCTGKGQMADAMEKPMMNMNSPPLTPVSVDSIQGLVQLVELLLDPSDVRKVIAGLDGASNSGAAAEQAKAAERDLAGLRQDLESERAKHEATLARERAEHESAMGRERAEAEAIKKAALELKAKAEADAAAAKWIKEDLMRRFKPVNGVV